MSRFGHRFGFPFNRESFLHDLWDSPLHRRIFDQHFGVGVLSDDDFVPYTLFDRYYTRSRRTESRPDSGFSESQPTSTKFKVMLDCSHFTYSEISVKTVDNYVVVNAKHEERPDEHGFIAREFTRRYILPEDVIPETVTSALTRGGILVIEAPKKNAETPASNERTVPIAKLEENSASTSQIPNDQPSTSSQKQTSL